jgi:hypothetical protein
MTDRELCEQIALEMGVDWHVFIVPVPPSYTTDLNALRDGPERVLREAEVWLRVESFSAVDGVEAETGVEWVTNQGRIVASAPAPTEARARAEAALMALRVMKGEGNGN